MAQILNIHPPPPPYLTLRRPSTVAPPLPSRPPTLYSSGDALAGNPNPRWTALQRELKCQGRHSCFFADGRKQDQAKKALESALGGKKSEFEKWNKEIEKREEIGRGGGGSGRGGWFGGGGWFGEHFWEEAQQAILTILAIVSLFLLIAKGNVMFVVIVNPLLFVLRGVRNWFAYVSSRLSFARTSTEPAIGAYQPQAPVPPMSAKERVVRKWGMD